MKKNLQYFLASVITFFGLVIFPALPAMAAGGSMTPSGGGKFVAGQTFTVKVVAGGATFNAFQGQISVSGPVSVVSFSQGSFSLINGKVANGSSFAAYVTSAVSSITVATIQLKGTKEGTGSVSVTGVRLADAGTEVGTTGGSTSFTITRAPTPPGTVTVTSSTHPDQAQAYTATSAVFSWTAPTNGTNGYSTVFDSTSDTTPATKVSTTATTEHHDNLAVGTYYFHIRAQNADGWGPTAHFKIAVREPDPVLDAAQQKPIITGISKTGDYTIDITNGTLSGLTFAGTGPAGYTINLTLSPKERMPSDAKLSALVDETGKWTITVTSAVPAGFYKVVAQGIKDKTLTSPSDEQAFEISLAKGGDVHYITQADMPVKILPEAEKKAPTNVLAAHLTRSTELGIGALVIILIAILAVVFRKRLFRTGS